MKNWTHFHFCLLLLVLIACESPKEPRTAGNVHADFIATYFKYFNEHNWEKLAGMYTPVAEFKDPSLGKNSVMQTRAQTIKKYTSLCQTFPNLQDKVVKAYPSGDKYVVVEFISKGTAKDGTSFELSICTIFTMQDGLIVADYTYYDNF